MAPYRNNLAFGSVWGLLAAVATSVMLVNPAAALDRLLRLGDIDLRPVMESACDSAKKLSDEAALQNLKKSILDIQARVKGEYGARLHTATEVGRGWDAEKRKLDQLETDIKELKSKAADKVRVERAETALSQQKNVFEHASKALLEVEDKRKEAKSALETVDEQVPVDLKCIEVRIAAIKGDVIPKSTCFSTSQGSFPCEIVPTDADGSFDIKGPGIKYTFNMAEPGVAYVFMALGEGMKERNVPLPGRYKRSKSEPACWESETKGNKICLQ